MALAAAFALALLTTGTLPVPPSAWRSVPLRIEAHGTTIDCGFEVARGTPRVQVMILRVADADRFRQGRSFRPLYATGLESSYRFRYVFREAGEYALVFDNRLEGRFPATVLFQVDSYVRGENGVRTLPVERRRAVVALSLLFFGAVLVYSARQFLRRV